MSFIRYRNDVFIRHCKDESVVWAPHTGGCSVMRNAKPFLDAVTRQWRSVDEIREEIVAKCECSQLDAREGVDAVVGELMNQGFVKIKHTNSVKNSNENGQDEEFPVFTGGCIDDADDWTPLGGFYTRHGLPSELHIDLTDGCNEKCVHCYLSKCGRQYLDKEIAFKVLKEFRDAQGLTVFISGGECLLHRDCFAILKYIRSLDLNVIVMSNLTLCDEKTVSLLSEVEPQFVNVSLYAVTESIHDSITKIPGSCRKTKYAIDLLQSAGVHVRIATPIMRENAGCIDELKEYAADRHMHLIVSPTFQEKRENSSMAGVFSFFG